MECGCTRRACGTNGSASTPYMFARFMGRVCPLHFGPYTPYFVHPSSISGQLATFDFTPLAYSCLNPAVQARIQGPTGLAAELDNSNSSTFIHETARGDQTKPHPRVGNLLMTLCLIPHRPLLLRSDGHLKCQKSHYIKLRSSVPTVH